MSAQGVGIRLKEWTDAAANAIACSDVRPPAIKDVTMKTTVFTLLLGASFMAACDSTPTSPDARTIQTPTKPTDLLIGLGPTWHATMLSFMPRAINDAGTVVGSQTVGLDTRGVMYQSGTLYPLGISTDPICWGHVTPSAISPSGVVAGTAGDCVLMWVTPGGDPFELFRGTTPTLQYSVLAVYDDWTVIVKGTNSSGSFAFERVNVGSNAQSPYGFIPTSADGQKNVYGYTTSNRPARWSAASGLQLMPVPAPMTGGVITSADSRGDALGFLSDGTTGERVVWSPNGVVSVLTRLPENLKFMNGSGRFVGHAVNGAPPQIWTSINGVLTWLASPDPSSAYEATGVNGCGSIVALHSSGPTLSGALFTRSSLVAPVCDQAPSITTAAPTVTSS
jgi:hypothetical protein